MREYSQGRQKFHTRIVFVETVSEMTSRNGQPATLKRRNPAK
jgi:hypothetical protein